MSAAPSAAGTDAKCANACGATASLRCARCLGAWYCGVACQRAEWPSHKESCKKAAAMMAAGGVTSPALFDRAHDAMRSLAAAGDARALFALGSLYSTGSGVPADKAEAFRLWERAAAQGHPDAMYNIAMMQRTEERFFDLRASATWLKRSAAAGDERSFGLLAFYFEKGLGGLPVSQGEAAALWARAAAARDPMVAAAGREYFAQGARLRGSV